MIKAWWRHFACEVMGWHRADWQAKGRQDGVNLHLPCRRCGYWGMIDSQGNLF